MANISDDSMVIVKANNDVATVEGHSEGCLDVTMADMSQTLNEQSMASYHSSKIEEVDDEKENENENENELKEAQEDLESSPPMKSTQEQTLDTDQSPNKNFVYEDDNE